MEIVLFALGVVFVFLVVSEIRVNIKVTKLNDYVDERFRNLRSDITDAKYYHASDYGTLEKLLVLSQRIGKIEMAIEPEEVKQARKTLEEYKEKG